MASLYRTYRPARFSELIGQEPIRRTLQNALAKERVGHAYIFAGAKGTGKTSIARILAKALNCTAGDLREPCGVCDLCVAIANGSSFDVIEMDAASQRGIDDIRELRNHSSLAPAVGQEKVYILDEAHQLTDAAWNALLKLIEEPPPHLHFIFCTTELDKVPETVRSRCQTFVFAKPSTDAVDRYLQRMIDGEGVAVTAGARQLIAEQARGSFRDAATLLDQLLDGADGELTEEQVRGLLGLTGIDTLHALVEALAARDGAALLALSEQLSLAGADFSRVTADLAERLRRLLLLTHLGQEALPEAGREILEAEAALFDGAFLLALLDALVSAAARRGDAHLLFELALLGAFAV